MFFSLPGKNAYLYSFIPKVYFSNMFNEEVRRLLIKVISSWQVIAVTIALVVYFSLVNYVTRVHQRRPRILPKKKPKPSAPEEPATSETDELGLEENNDV